MKINLIKYLRTKLVHRLLQDRRGGILLIALLVLVLLSLISVMATTSTMTETKIAANHKTNTQALYLAEAGLEHAKAKLREMSLNDALAGPDEDKDSDADNGIFPDLQNVSFGPGSYSVVITDNSDYENPADGDGDGEVWEDSNNRIFITSTGRIGNAEKTIQIEYSKIQVPIEPDGALAFYTPPPPTLMLHGAAEISGYNYHVPSNFNCHGASCNGTIDTSHPGIPGVYSETMLEDEENPNDDNLITRGHAFTIDGNPPIDDDGGGRYTNAFWIDLANSLIPYAVTLDASTVAGSGTLGTRDNPQITYITEEVTFSGSIDGAGILIINDGVHFTGNSHFEGVVIVLSNDDDADEEVSWGTGNPNFFGTMVIAGNSPGIADFRGNPAVKFSTEALENINNNLNITKVLSWRDMAF